MRLDRQELAVRMAALHTRGGLAYARALASDGWRDAPRRVVGEDARRPVGWLRDGLADMAMLCIRAVLAPVLPRQRQTAAGRGFQILVHRAGRAFARRSMEALYRDMLAAWRVAGWLPGLPRFEPTAAGDHHFGGLAVYQMAAAGKSWVWSNTLAAGGRVGTVTLRPEARRSAVARRRYIPFIDSAMTLAHEAAHTVFGTLAAPFRLPEEHPGHACSGALNRGLLGITGRSANNEHSTAFNEMFADVYGAMLVLETFGHTKTVLDELRLFRDIRVANSQATLALLVEHSRDGLVSAGGCACGGPGIDFYLTADAITQVLDNHAAWRGQDGAAMVETACRIVSACWWRQFLGQPSAYGMQPAPGGICGIMSDRQSAIAVRDAPLLIECAAAMVYEGRAGAVDFLDACERSLGTHPAIDFWKSRFEEKAFAEWYPGFAGSGTGERLTRIGSATPGSLLDTIEAVMDAMGRCNEAAFITWRQGGKMGEAAGRERQALADLLMHGGEDGGPLAEPSVPMRAAPRRAP